MAAKSSSESKPEELTIPTLSLRGDFIDDVQALSATSASLLVAVGNLNEGDNAHVIVPFVKITLTEQGEEGASTSFPAYSETLTLDNAFFVLSDLSQGLRFACEDLGMIGGVAAKHEPARLALAKKFAQSAKMAIESAIQALDRIPGQSG